MKNWVIRKLGGYYDQESFLASLDPSTRDEILTQAVKKLFNTLDADDILREGENGQWFLEDKPLATAQQQLLAAEATQFLSTKLWPVLCADVKYQANKQMYLLAEDKVQITAGKLWQFTLDCFKTRLESLSKGRAIFNSNPKGMPR